MPCLNHPEVDVYTHGNYPVRTEKTEFGGKNEWKQGITYLVSHWREVTLSIDSEWRTGVQSKSMWVTVAKKAKSKFVGLNAGPI
ncbi:hypothetical protein F2Q69_00020305 [Brassica cretica]|uniref:Uncharacterized protein n=1 Tax=Brassica cretica TaxID=69181 RepID=A0A8S9QAL6_BRACR|nr:hypothetical protein F2Q69_00020305 [Brassica cretica]